MFYHSCHSLQQQEQLEMQVLNGATALLANKNSIFHLVMIVECGQGQGKESE